MADQPVQPTKPFWASWTIVFNILSGIIVVLNQISPFATVFIHDTSQAKNVSDLISAFIVIINILLRFKTDTGVRFALK